MDHSYLLIGENTFSDISPARELGVTQTPGFEEKYKRSCKVKILAGKDMMFVSPDQRHCRMISDRKHRRTCGVYKYGLVII